MRAAKNKGFEKVTYSEVVRSLGAVRESVLEGYRAMGGSRERWGRREWEIMARELTRAEDGLEGRRANDETRAVVRDVRRRLEEMTEA